MRYNKQAIPCFIYVVEKQRSLYVERKFAVPDHLVSCAIQQKDL